MHARKVDELGRIVLPAEIRAALGLEAGTSLDVFLDQEHNIILHKASEANERCILCHGRDDLVPVHGKPVCAACRDRIKHS